MKMKRTSLPSILLSAACIVALGLFASCGGSSSSSASLDSSTTIKSSNLSTSVSALSREGAVVKSAVTGLNEAANPCPTGTTTCYSPTAMGGKFSGFSIRISTNGEFQRLELVSPPQGTDDDGDEVTVASLSSFDLGSPAAIAGTPTVDTSSLNDTSHFADVVWTIGWIDAQFDKAEFGLGAGTVTYRLVYITDPATEYQRGDVLIKDGTEFKWCTTGATSMANCYTTRAAADAAGDVLTQNAGIVNYSAASGDPELPYLIAGFSASASNEGEVTVTATDLAGAVSFTADFDHAKVFAIEAVNANTTITDVFDVMDEIYVRGLSATPTGVTVAGGINAVLTVSK